MTPTRRQVLEVASLGFGAVLAGCLSGTLESDPGGSDGGDDDEVTVIEHDVVPLAVETDRPWWYDDDEPTGYVDLFATGESVHERLPFGRVPEDRRDEVQQFVEATDFEVARLLYVASVGPNACYSEVAVSDLGVEADRIVGSAAAIDSTADEDDEELACAQVVTFPSALVRVEFDGEPPNDASIEITDGWGDEAIVGATTGPATPIDPDELPGHVRPDGEPETVPDALICDEEPFERHGAWFDEDDLEWGEATDEEGRVRLALRVDELAYELGETVTVALTNVTNGRQYTGNRHKYNLQVRTEGGWQDVRGSTDEDGLLPYTDEAVVHEAGDGFEWSFELTEDGVVEDHVHEDTLAVCPDLGPGRYRFVFWEPAVAVAFDVVA